MAYPAFDTYNNQVGFPAFNRTMSYHPTEYGGYNDGVLAGGYGENYPQSAHSLYSAGRQLSHYAGGYDDVDGYYPDRPVTPGYAPRLSHRRFSSVSHRTRPPLDGYRRGYSSTMIKFRRKGGFRSGVTLGEAMASTRLSGNDAYTYSDLAVDNRGRILLRIRWTGYTSMTYEIPVDGYEGRVQLQTIARRIARAVVHFLQANMIPVSWDRVILYHLEEHSPGVWQPVLSTS